MIEITNEQQERVHLLLSGIKGAPAKVFPNVINRALGTVRSQSGKYIRETYNIKQSEITSNRNMKVKNAAGSNLSGEILFGGSVIPLYKFSVGKGSRGVNASVIKGTREELRHAYITNLGKYGTGVFERELKRRDSSKQLYGPSTAHMMGNEDVLSKVEAAAQDTINKRVEHEITRILNSY